MSSSTERKIRQAARENGTDRKTIAEREAAAKKKKDTIKWTIVGILIFLFIAATVYLNSGLFYRSTTAVTMDNTELAEYNIEAGSRNFSIAEVNFVYNTQVMNIVSYLGDYASYMGLDLSQPLSQQPCSFGAADSEDKSYTWDDYFMEATYTQLKQTAALCAYADYADISLDDEELKAVEDNVAAIADAAEQNGYSSANKFLGANYGTGCNVALAREMMTEQALAAKVQTVIGESFEYTDKQLSEKYASVADSYDIFAYNYYFAAAETTADENGNMVASEEALAASKATAEEILAAIKDGDSFADATKNIVGQVETTVTNEDGTTSTEMQDAAPTSDENVAGADIPSAISAWLLDAERAENDIDIVESDSGYYVVQFISRDDNKHTTEESGDMLACDYIADGLLRNDDLAAWMEDILAGITEVYSTADRFAIKYVGR